MFFYLLRNDLILRTNPAYATTTESKFEGDSAYNVAAGNTGSEIEAKPFVMPGLQEPQSQAGKKQPYRQYGQPYSDDKPFAIKPVIKGTYRDLFEKMSGRQRGIYSGITANATSSIKAKLNYNPLQNQSSENKASYERLYDKIRRALYGLFPKISGFYKSSSESFKSLRQGAQELYRGEAANHNEQKYQDFEDENLDRKVISLDAYRKRLQYKTAKTTLYITQPSRLEEIAEERLAA